MREVVRAVDRDALGSWQGLGHHVRHWREEGGALGPAGQQRRSVKARQRAQVHLEGVGVPDLVEPRRRVRDEQLAHLGRELPVPGAGTKRDRLHEQARSVLMIVALEELDHSADASLHLFPSGLQLGSGQQREQWRLVRDQGADVVGDIGKIAAGIGLGANAVRPSRRGLMLRPLLRMREGFDAIT